MEKSNTGNDYNCIRCRFDLKQDSSWKCDSCGWNNEFKWLLSNSDFSLAVDMHNERLSNGPQLEEQHRKLMKNNQEVEARILTAESVPELLKQTEGLRERITTTNQLLFKKKEDYGRLDDRCRELSQAIRQKETSLKGIDFLISHRYPSSNRYKAKIWVERSTFHLSVDSTPKSFSTFWLCLQTKNETAMGSTVYFVGVEKLEPIMTLGFQINTRQFEVNQLAELFGFHGEYFLNLICLDEANVKLDIERRNQCLIQL